MQGCIFLVCLHRLWYRVSVLWKRKENRLEYLGKISKGNGDIYKTFVSIKTSWYDIKIIVNFVVIMYDASCPHTRVKDCQKYLFSKLNRTIHQCPSTNDPLGQHILRAMLQSYIWPKSTQLKEESTSVTDMGWDVDMRKM